MATSTQTIIAYFTSRGSLVTGLSPKLDIWDSDGAQTVTSGSMTEVGTKVGFYKYDFEDYDDTTEYIFRTDGGSSLGVKDRYGYASNQAVPDSVTISLEEIKGDGFDTKTDSLEQISDALGSVLDISGGYWKIENGKLNMYNYNNNIIISSFDMKDKLLQASRDATKRYR